MEVCSSAETASQSQKGQREKGDILFYEHILPLPFQIDAVIDYFDYFVVVPIDSHSAGARGAGCRSY